MSGNRTWTDDQGFGYPFPEREPNTVGVTHGCRDMNMPPFAVDMVGGQGNGDATDAVIALRGRIINDFAGHAQPESSVYGVMGRRDEFALVVLALEFVADNGVPDGPWDHLACCHEHVEDAMHYLAKRYRMVPGVEAELQIGKP